MPNFDGHAPFRTPARRCESDKRWLDNDAQEFGAVDRLFRRVPRRGSVLLLLVHLVVVDDGVDERPVELAIEQRLLLSGGLVRHLHPLDGEHRQRREELL